MCNPRRILPFLLLALCLPAQKLNPVEWSVTAAPAEVAPGGEVRLELRAKIQEGWHLYSFTTPPGGPKPTTVRITGGPVESFAVYQPKPTTRFDPNFDLDTETFEGAATFVILAKIAEDATSGPAAIPIVVRNQSCDDSLCLPPRSFDLEAAIQVAANASEPPPIAGAFTKVFDGVKEEAESPARAAAQPSPATAKPAADQGLAAFLLLAFGFGLASIFTPCVFPMIPITMSYFLGSGEEKRASPVGQAALFCFGIIALFTGMGLALTAILGPFGVVQLGANPWVNLFIALVFLVFGLSLLGAFEITIPSSVLNRLNASSQGGGWIGTLLMGLTFSLAAFACVGPFVGTILAASVEGGGMRPALGMVSFSAGLASPFFLLALFPSFLRKMPRSGGWMARVKIVMGFVILAAMLKYLSTADQVLHWNLLTRERFLAAWIVLFSFAGLYLLGFLRLPGVKPQEELSLSRLLAGGAFLVFSISLAPGIFGAPLGELEPYVPAPSANAAFGGAPAQADGAWIKNDLDAAVEQARTENKPLLVSFTGYACTNCKWMKANMFTRPEVAQALGEFVLLELYTDGADTVSEANQKLEEERFQTVAIPYYAIMDSSQNVLATFAGLTRNEEEFLQFLAKREGVQRASR